jgi:hypothetical protein
METNFVPLLRRHFPRKKIIKKFRNILNQTSIEEQQMTHVFLCLFTAPSVLSPLFWDKINVTKTQ